MKKTLLLSLTTIFFTCCINDTFTESEFIEAIENDSHGIKLMERGKTILAYEPASWQLGFSNTKKEFRVHDDQMVYYYTLTCDTMPTAEGQTIEGTLRWTTYNDSKSRHMAFTVSRFDTDGKIWLWNSKYQIGVVVVEVR